MKIAEHLTKPISKILKFLLRRLVFVTVAIILQMIWMTYMVVVIGEYSKAIEWVFRIFSITVVIYIANKDDNPAYKLAWTIPILLFPIFGGFLYLVLGDKQPAKKLRMELEQSIEDTEFLLGPGRLSGRRTGKVYRSVWWISDLREFRCEVLSIGRGNV